MTLVKCRDEDGDEIFINLDLVRSIILFADDTNAPVTAELRFDDDPDTAEEVLLEGRLAEIVRDAEVAYAAATRRQSADERLRLTRDEKANT